MANVFGSLAPPVSDQQEVPPDITAALLRAAMAHGRQDQLLNPPKNPLAPPDAVNRGVAGALSGLGEFVRTPSAQMKSNPYPEGSEEAQWYDNQKADKAAEWAPEAALATMGTGAIAGVPMRAGEAALGSGPIRAYHSSPHDFERFDASRIGSGEGAQTYGHGLYFAENPKVSGQGGEYWNQFMRKFGGAEADAADLLRVHGFDRDKALGELTRVAPLDDPYTAQMARLIESGAPVGPRTYEVAINARPEQMLDWDKPLAEQGHVGGIAAKLADIPDASAAFAPGATAYRVFGAPDRAAAALRDAGIPGIRYLDQGSRQIQPPAALEAELSRIRNEIVARPDKAGALRLAERDVLAQVEAARGKPTSNYVVFPGNEHLIDILKKYGVAGAAGPAAGAASFGSLAPDARAQ